MTTQKLSVIILGAGAAGIAAACRLLEYGVCDIIILEAEGRIGGRIHTTKFGNGVVDLGAHWVHGETGNVVSSMAQPLNLLGDTLTEITDTQFVSSSGECLGTDTSAKFLGILMDIIQSSKEHLKTFQGSLGDYLTKEFQNQLSENNLTKLEMYYAKSFLDWFEKFENSIDGSDSWFYTSGRGHTEYQECEGNLLQTWKSGGYDNLFDLLMKKYPDPRNELPISKKIIFNKEIVNIEWDRVADNKVKVKCLDESNYIADHVIVTACLGVLKERAMSLFTPELSAKKLTAINGLSIGTVDKIYLRFPHQWWPQRTLGFSFLWTEEDTYNFNRDHQTDGGTDRHWLTDVFGFYEVDLQPNVLCGWVIGPSARKMESLSEAEVTDGCMELLNRFLGQKFKVPQPVEMLRSAWSLNPHFRGSYSFRSMDTELANTAAAQLAEPLTNSMGKQTVLFAGEATHDHFFSTVHGAVESGWREAERVMKLLSHDVGCKVPLSYSNVSACAKVVIVGAGLAGLAAARTLLESGVENIVILEAQDHAGGRVLSWPLNDGWVEAGAQWIHGQGNDVWRLANDFNLLAEYTSSEGEGPYIRDDGVVFAPRLVFEVDKVVSNILEDCEQFSKMSSNSDEVPLSIGQYLQCKFLKYLSSCSTDSKEMRQMKEELFDWHVRFQKIDNSSTMLDNLSARSWGNYSFCGGTDYVNFKQGYSSLVEILTNSLPHDILRLNTPVTSIHWDQNITVTTNGDNFVEDVETYNIKHANITNTRNILPSTEEGACSKLPHLPVVISCSNGLDISTQHCIVTCSLGYLKENWERMFEPALPYTLTKTVKDMGFATINKIYLDFRQPWWTPDIKGFQLIWSKNSKECVGQLDSWTRDLTGFDVLPNAPGVLLGWIGGMGAEQVECLGEEEIGQQCTDLLRRFTKRKDIPQPRNVLRTRWHSNPYIRGGYSHTTSACDMSNVGPSTLAQPVYANFGNKPEYPIILFAGEATHECYFSTTHGAYESGQKQANVILKYHELV